MDNFQRYLKPDSGFLNPIKTQILAGLSEALVPDISHLSEQLHASLDIKRVLQTFTTEAASFVHLSGIRFQCESICVETEGFIEGIYEHITELSTENKTVGYITYSAYREIGPNQAKILHHMQTKLAQPVFNAVQFNLLQQQALKDYLTGLGNRASFDEQIEIAIQRCHRSHAGISLLLLDLDNFKFANDTFGHAEGDKVLQAFADIITHSVRRTDIAFRFGGDEFAVILDTDNPDIAIQVKQRVQNMVARSLIMSNTSVSCSIGFAHWQQTDTSKQLFMRADQALYQNKSNYKKQLRRA
ncbi:GGDEF domain-containing protein [Catenovulum adriaticum]|uniref:diguanylate cyclase n=1 Tax=Catenovulum adriaticum TaxID=2984846 RepID=A0ABY7AK76_9ALTE|nr:GGDEF domain-containing protein [Catenovulum sp. TS8]WAJ69546.1 GGDEF domain-containing protein [Catenovulum sp. TS8]